MIVHIQCVDLVLLYLQHDKVIQSHLYKVEQ